MAPAPAAVENFERGASGHAAARASSRRGQSGKREQRGWRAGPGRPRLRRIAGWLFLGVVAVLLATQARRVDWGAVLASMREIPPPMLLAAAALAAASHLLYSTYDLFGRRATGHPLGTGEVMRIAFISYAFNLNLGALIGGVAFRFRLYARHGLESRTVAQVLGFSLLTNWLGYLMLAGALFCLRPLALPPGWHVGGGGVRILGAALLVAGFTYLALCAFSRRRRIRVRRLAFDTPPLSTALLQLVVSLANWSLIGAVIWCLLQQRLPYLDVLPVLLIAAVAGVIVHIPAGLGVLEGVFLALLGHRIAPDSLLGALLAYRAIYYLAPLAVASVAYVAVELRMRRRRIAGR